VQGTHGDRCMVCCLEGGHTHTHTHTHTHRAVRYTNVPTAVPLSAAGRQCGFPGRPRNGTSATAAPVSRPGDTAHYTCRPGYTLFGEEERVCLDSGIWAGRQPLCGECRLHNVVRHSVGRRFSPGQITDRADPSGPAV
jgi:hypothetical protein